MELSSIVVGILGIIVSIITYILSYKRTIGAKIERIKSTKQEINKILYRNLILEKHIPSFEEISRIISTKASDLKIKESDLPNNEYFLNALYTRLIEDELIEKKIKNELMTKLNEKINLESKKTNIKNENIKNTDTFFSSFVAIISIVSGMSIFIIFSYDYSLNLLDLKTVMSMLIIITMIILFTQNVLRMKYYI